MSITEPSTLISDYLLGAVTLVLAGRLAGGGLREGPVSRRLWAAALLTASLSAFTGGTFHGFAQHLGESGRLVLWKGTLCLIGAMALLMLSGSIWAVCKRPFRQWLLAATFLKFLSYAVWMSTHDDFRGALCDYAASMAGVLALHAYARSPSSKWMTGGVLLSFLGAALQMGQMDLHEHFNRNDLFHTIQAAANLLFFRGARLLQ